MSGDRNWLRKEGWPLLREVADFWTSRAERNDDGTYSIRNVVCADEYAEGVDDNAFTNGSAMRALQAASKAAALCGEKAPAIWNTIAASLRIPRFEDGTTREYEDYDGRIIKQADADLLAYRSDSSPTRRRFAATWRITSRASTQVRPCPIPYSPCNTPGWVTAGKPTSSSRAATSPTAWLRSA